MTLIIILLGAFLIPRRTAENNGLLESRNRWGRRGCNFHAWLWRKCSEGDEKRKKKRKKKKKKKKERKTKGRRHILSAHAAASPLVGRQKVQKTACNWCDHVESWALFSFTVLFFLNSLGNIKLIVCSAMWFEYFYIKVYLSWIVIYLMFLWMIFL